MQYHGKLYGKIAGTYFDTGSTSDDYDQIQQKLKEYEEKLRWIPVEEKLPESNKIAIEFKTKKESIYYGFYGLSCNFYVMLAELLDKNIQVNEVTHWRYFL